MQGKGMVTGEKQYVSKRQGAAVSGLLAMSGLSEIE